MTLSVFERIVLGDPSALNDCISDHGALVWSMARRWSRTASDAEDATQEIFFAVWRSADRFDPALGCGRMFVAMIARRRLVDRLRRVSVEPRMDPLEVLEYIPCQNVEWQTDISMDADQASRLIAQLRPAQREVLELSFVRGYSHPQIAQYLKMPLGTVKSCVRRGLLRVRQLMDDSAIPTNRGSSRLQCRSAKHHSLPSPGSQLRQSNRIGRLHPPKSPDADAVELSESPIEVTR